MIAVTIAFEAIAVLGAPANGVGMSARLELTHPFPKPALGVAG